MRIGKKIKVLGILIITSIVVILVYLFYFIKITDAYNILALYGRIRYGNIIKINGIHMNVPKDYYLDEHKKDEYGLTKKPINKLDTSLTGIFIKKHNVTNISFYDQSFINKLEGEDRRLIEIDTFIVNDQLQLIGAIFINDSTNIITAHYIVPNYDVLIHFSDYPTKYEYIREFLKNSQIRIE